ncbi:TonB-dependent receptor [Carboxylicivirga sp. A043]|uniref:TonB-dependent receptor n=1 Tax=Carboxylicivirga litoralis TaxID=2816963 RepID=UPI0021CB3159|nr:TonB-dependent receptor [Carboxylicivirga sp. A043]MCU4156075.1 TonB-dependent receptor [Carboxylicivirga sp. A043]
MRISALTNCLCFLLSCFWQPTTAQIDTTNLKQRQLNEVTVSAPVTILSVKQWPGSLVSIDSLTIQSGNSYLLSQQLNNLPGVLMQQGTLSTSRITIRGIGSRTPYNSNRIKAYWGDIPLTDGDGVSSIEDIGFNDINNIQILKGPSSALYGAGLGGVVLINPWYPASKTSIAAGFEAGSYGTYSSQLSAVLKQEKGTTWLTANQLISDGYRNNSEYKRYNITLKGKYKLGTHLLHYLYNHRHLNAHIPSSLDSVDFYNQPEKAADSWAAIEGYEKSNRQIISIGLSSGLNNLLSNSLHLFGIISTLDELRPFNQLDESKLTIGIRNKLSYRKQSIRLALGFEAINEMNTVKLYGVRPNNLGQLLNKNDIERSYINIFGLLDIDISDKLIMQAGLNYNITSYKNKDKVNGIKSDHQYPATLSPRLGINYQLTNSSNLFAAAGHGFSTPSVEEAQMPDGSFNASIKPEEGYHVDIGYHYQSVNNKTNADFTLYWIKLNNLLVTKRESEELFYGINAGETSHKGVELSVQHQLDFNNLSHIKLSGTFSHSINKFERFTDEGIDYSHKHLPGIPEYTAHLSATYILRKTQLYINNQFFGQQYLTDSNSKRYDDFSVLNCKLSHNTTIGKIATTFYLGINNINDKQYASMLLINAPSFGNNLPRYYYPALPRNWYGGIIIRI